MRFWWVNQNQTYKHEFEGGYMWSPKINSDGARNEFYENMTRVEPADVVFSFKGALIVSMGIIQSRAYTSRKPDEFGKSGEAWSDEGWCVDVEYHEVSHKIKPKLHIDEIRPLLPKKYSPLKPDGDGNQVYLCAVPDDMANYLMGLIGEEAKNIVDGLDAEYVINNVENEVERNIISDSKLPQTEKNQLVKSRRGQGVFRSRLETIEPYCRVTGISNKTHLIASHIKPWSVSNNQERLDGHNGLLLSPHIDHIFDKGYISFENNGDFIVSVKTSNGLLDAWSVEIKNVGQFNAKQRVYLDYHRKQVLKN